ncbi:helix-turn-helix domain-containing protein [Rodentibacter pneumotropicus]|nr:helix-turn-helix domain-containing protein [Rodentibacter pneumotropicus]NBH74639.1 helix-turn-helix domain-containing protein [Rodentibacter pneumotropicus]TGZ98714.1 helix-turn-helix domain-containing protein [Rodentibacter pneumotropicus]THA06487.1 helix-turn-helix domain-containing protein [Rodentibacter pneumotropicus]THA11615.1 helix-turn-helix domain-containing protein [Rodentibacter pneumotropicus]THA17190.1 helix-turn-helix domain-containing protein [Rodentibacter pneumotropicus]
MAKKLTNLDDFLAELPRDRQTKIQEMAEELILEAGLSKLREDLELSQKDLAASLGISQPAVAQIEQRGNDIRLSTLKRYVETMGGKLSLAVEMPTGNSRIFKI